MLITYHNHYYNDHEVCTSTQWISRRTRDLQASTLGSPSLSRGTSPGSRCLRRMMTFLATLIVIMMTSTTMMMTLGVAITEQRNFTRLEVVINDENSSEYCDDDQLWQDTAKLHDPTILNHARFSQVSSTRCPVWEDRWNKVLKMPKWTSPLLL